jgi:IS5 family transposase
MDDKPRQWDDLNPRMDNLTPRSALPVDKVYDGVRFREHLLIRSILPIIMPRSNRKNTRALWLKALPRPQPRRTPVAQTQAVLTSGDPLVLDYPKVR